MVAEVLLSSCRARCLTPTILILTASNGTPVPHLHFHLAQCERGLLGGGVRVQGQAARTLQVGVVGAPRILPVFSRILDSPYLYIPHWPRCLRVL